MRAHVAGGDVVGVKRVTAVRQAAVGPARGNGNQESVTVARASLSTVI